MPGELAEDAGLSAQQEVSRVMTSVLARLDWEMTDRFTRLETLHTNFGFLLDVAGLFEKDQTELRANCETISNVYNNDTDGGELLAEICDCKMLLAARDDVIATTPLQLLSFIVAYGEDVFPNLQVALQILLTTAVSIASCERSFSKLKLILSYLRASMGQERLSNLALMSIERETFEQVNFDEVIDNFAGQKARKISFNL